MAMYNEAINAYVNRFVRSDLYSNQLKSRPLLFFLAGAGQTGLDPLVRPYGRKGSAHPNENYKFGTSVGGSMGLAKRLKTLGSVSHEIRFQKSAPTGHTNVSVGGATPTAAQSSTKLVGTTATHWTKSMIPYKIDNSDLENAKGKTAIAALLEEAVSMTTNQHYADLQTEMYTGTLTSAQQAETQWDNLLGLDHLVSDGTTTNETNFTHIGRVDRTVETHLKSIVSDADTLAAAGTIPTTQANLSLIKKILTMSSLGGISTYAGGTGDLVITTADVWNTLSEEAEDQGIVNYNVSMEVPGMGKTVSFDKPVIQYGPSNITFDPDCPSGTMFVLSSGALCYEVQPGNNFRIQDLVNKAETEEGGNDYSWGKMIHKHRLTILAPHLCAKVVDLTA